MKINVRLNSKDISTAISQVERTKVELMAKLEQFVSELADVGIEVIKDNVKIEVDGEVRNFGDSVVFRKEISETSDGATCLLIVSGNEFLKEWTAGSAMVNPLLMAEFGSGRYAGEHRGSFPNQTHALNPPWFWVDMNGKKHKSYGNEPSRPLYKATVEMEEQIHEVAERVFST